VEKRYIPKREVIDLIYSRDYLGYSVPEYAGIPVTHRGLASHLGCHRA